MLAGAAFGIAFIIDRAEMQFQRSREQLATALAYALDGQIERLKPMMRALAREPEGHPDAPEAEKREFHARLRRLGEEFDAIFWLQGSDRSYPWIMASSLPFGMVPATDLREDTRALRALAEASGRPELGNLVLRSVVTGQPAVRLVAPLTDGDAQVGALGLVLRPESFTRILGAQQIAPPEFATLVDGVGRIVASSERQGWKLGEVEPYASAMPTGVASGTMTNISLRGDTVRISFARLPNSPTWVVGVSTPESVYRTDRLRRWLLFGPGALASIAVGLITAFALARQLLLPLARVTRGAEAIADGRAWPETARREGTRVDEFLRLERAVQRSQERLLAEAQAARRQEALLSSVTESTTYAIFVKDLNGRYQLVNRAAAWGLGHPPAAVIGHTDAELLPAAASAFSASDRQVLATGTAGIFEVQVTHSGAVRTWQVAKAPWRDPATGTLLGVVGLSRDVTTELEAEAKLRDSQQALQTLARRATINAMASGMAHELSQPLTAAANYLHVAATIAERDGSAATQPLRLGQEQVRRAGDILRQVRQFLRRDDTERQLSAIGELVEDAMHLALGGFDGTPPLAEFRAEPGLPMQLVNPVQIQQVVINLVRNACEALAELPGGRQGRISVRVGATEDGGASVTVEDNGPGMPAAILETLFEPFRSTKPAGSGIGLAICRAIVESHGGRITVTAADGGGSTIRFTLPGTAAADAEATR